MSPIYYNWIWNHKVKILLISLVQFVYLRLVELIRWSCKVTRFLMFWYLSKISLHLEMLFPSCPSSRGLASTCLAGQEFPPTIALKKHKFEESRCQHLRGRRNVKWKVYFAFYQWPGIGNITCFNKLPHTPLFLLHSLQKTEVIIPKKCQHKIDKKCFPLSCIYRYGKKYHCQIWIVYILCINYFALVIMF